MMFPEMRWAIGKSHDAKLPASCPTSRGYRRDYLSHIMFAYKFISEILGRVKVGDWQVGGVVFHRNMFMGSRVSIKEYAFDNLKGYEC